MAMAGRSGAAGRCSTPTRSGCRTSATSLQTYAARSGDKSLEPASYLSKLADEGRGFASLARSREEIRVSFCAPISLGDVLSGGRALGRADRDRHGARLARRRGRKRTATTPGSSIATGGFSYRDEHGRRCRRRAAAGFRRLGVTRGTPVALYLPNTPYHPIAFFGAMRAGARVVHLSPLDAERELALQAQGQRRSHRS